MSNSRKVGPFRIRPHKRSGVETGKWYIDMPASLTGKRKRKFFDNRKSAHDMARQLDRALQLRAFGKSGISARAGIGFRRAVGLWALREDLRIQTRKKRQISLDTDKARLKSAIDFFGDDDLAHITEPRLVEYQAWRLKQGRSPDTINSDVKAVFKVLKWAVKGKRLPELPTVEQVGSEPRRFNPASDAELVRLIGQCPKRLRPLVRFLAETGCRTGEAFNLTWEDVDLTSSRVSIRANGAWTPKTRSSVREVFLSSILAVTLGQASRKSRYVFPGRHRDQAIKNIRKAFATAAKRAGIVGADGRARITPHDLRRAYATRVATLGIPPRILQANLGHAPGSRVTDRHYVAATEEARRAAFLPLPITSLEAAEVATSGNTSPSEQSEATAEAAN